MSARNWGYRAPFGRADRHEVPGGSVPAIPTGEQMESSVDPSSRRSTRPHSEYCVHLNTPSCRRRANHSRRCQEQLRLPLCSAGGPRIPSLWFADPADSNLHQVIGRHRVERADQSPVPACVWPLIVRRGRLKKLKLVFSHSCRVRLPEPCSEAVCGRGASKNRANWRAL